MTCQRIQNRGSVLLMAVGLLTMLGLLGSAFLIVAGLNRKTAAAFATQGRMDTVAKSKLAEYLYKIQADVPLDDSTDPARFYDATKTATGGESWLDDLPTDLTTISTTDGTMGASGAFDAQNVEYQVGARVYDASAFLNATFAQGITAAPPSGAFPITFLDMGRLLGGDATATAIAQAVRDETANGAYDSSDEVFLAGGNESAVTAAGRLKTKLGSLASKKDGLTAKSICRYSLVAAQVADTTQKEKADLNGDEAAIQTAFTNLLQGATIPSSYGVGPADLAKILTRRVVDFRTNAGSSVTIGSKKHFGLMRHAFICKAALCWTNDQLQSAIELINPYTTNISLVGYRLRSTGGAIISLTGDLPPNGGRAVFVSQAGKIPGTVIAGLDLTKTTAIIGPGDYPIGKVGPLAVPQVTGTPAYTMVRKDDALQRAAYSVANYATTATDPTTTATWGGSGSDLNHCTASAAPCPVFVRGGPFATVGDLMRIYWVEISADGDPFNIKALDESLTANSGNLNNGRLDMTAGAGGLGSGSGALNSPAVPVGCKATQFFMVRSTGVTPTDIETTNRLLYGRVNINTAPVAVLKCLPGISGASNAGGLASLITQNRPYKTAGQVASVLAGQYVSTTWYPTGAPYDAGTYALSSGSDDGIDLTVARQMTDLVKANAVYAWMSNYITVSSDVFLVYIRVQPGAGGAAAAQRYAALIDRSRCVAKGDKPSVLMFCQIPVP